MKFFIISTFGELLDVALHLQDVEKHEVVMWIPDHGCSKIGDGLVKKDPQWWLAMENMDDMFLPMPQDDQAVFLIDGCERGKMQDYLRSKGMAVFGGSAQGDVLENDRQAGQAIFKKAGFRQPESQNFTSIDDAIAFIQDNSDRLWILKQNGDAPKSLNHKGHFPDNSDMLWHLEQLKKRWNESTMGPVDFDLMEQVEGLEIAVSFYFNGHDYMRNSEGRAIAFINFEEKKEGDGGLGETCGEMGTTFFVTTEDHPIARDVVFGKPVIKQTLIEAGFRGIGDVNTIQTDRGYVALEFTLRPGVPSSSYEFCVATKNFGEVCAAVAQGKDTPIEVEYGWGMVMVVVAKPFPVEADMDAEATSVGEKLWILHNGDPQDEFSSEQRKFVHLENFYRDDDGNYLVATKNGYLLTVTAGGFRPVDRPQIPNIREHLIQRIGYNLYISGMKYRTDIGKRVEAFEQEIAGAIPTPKAGAAKKAKGESVLGY